MDEEAIMALVAETRHLPESLAETGTVQVVEGVVVIVVVVVVV